ncbi:MAG: serine/threonine protein kinase [Flavobacterium sp.]|nr:MAG: serine/threonine protein kinase [Flavobacterium sp.]
MNTNTLPSVLTDDNLLILLETFKNGLVSRATGKGFEEEEYQRIRKIILASPRLEKLVPRFLKTCRTSSDFWQWIKHESPSYDGRRQILADQVNPMLDAIEYESGEGALEFSKNYEEQNIIGTGGFGVVYKYEHRLLKMPFAVKVFAPAFYDGGTDQRELERFFQESRILFKLNHPNIIRIYDAGLIGNRPFIRMEYFDGKNLNEVLTEFGTQSEEKSIVALKHIVSAIAHAHDNGIIHRDLKPSNIMAAKPNQFRVIDFGLGIFIENELHSRLTKTGVQTISGYYNAPELVANPKLIDKRSDIYSLGAIWYTLLTGQPPAGSDFMSTLRPLGISEKTIDVIKKCLNPLEMRHKDCNELLADLEKL